MSVCHSKKYLMWLADKLLFENTLLWRTAPNGSMPGLIFLVQLSIVCVFVLFSFRCDIIASNGAGVGF